MLVNDTVPNLFNGISQQPASLRHRTQAELQENCFPTVAKGNDKRPCTQHVSVLAGITTNDNSLVHFINKSATERHVAVINSGVLAVYDATTGAAMTVLTPDGVGYITVADPSESLRAVTVADYTFIVNKTVTAALTGTTGSGSLTGTKQQFSALPGSPTLGDIYRIEGTPDSGFDDYYVEWDGSVWIETVKPGLLNTLDAATLPFQLVKTGATTFTLRKGTWPNRLTGDLVSAEVASVVGRTIVDVALHRNRLTLIAGEYAVLSRAGEPFTLWPETATESLDTDPIDTPAQGDEAALLTACVPFNKVLMLFSTKAQFQLTANGALTSKTAAIEQVTKFESSSKAHPVGAGQTLFFAVERESGTSLREYYVDVDTVANDAADITAHVPKYLPANVFKLAPSTTEDVLFVLTKNERNAVYVYKYFWASKDEKAQSAWGKFTFDTGCKVLGCEFFNNVVYWVIDRAGVASLERMSLDLNNTDAGIGFPVLLDRRTSLTGTYDSVNNWTTWTLPYSQAGTLEVVLGSLFTYSGVATAGVTRPTDYTVRAPGDLSAGPCFIGVPYTQRYRLSTFFVRDSDKVVTEDGRLQIRKALVRFSDTGYFRVEVTARGRPKNTYRFTAKEVGITTIGATNIATGSFEFPVMCRNTDAIIDFVNDSCMPSSFQSVQWFGTFTPKSSQV